MGLFPEVVSPRYRKLKIISTSYSYKLDNDLPPPFYQEKHVVCSRWLWFATFYSRHDLSQTLRRFTELEPRNIEDLRLLNPQFCPLYCCQHLHYRRNFEMTKKVFWYRVILTIHHKKNHHHHDNENPTIKTGTALVEHHSA